MPDVNWSLLNGGPNIGQSVMAGFQYGQQQRKQQAVQGALAAYAQNPDDPNSVNALIAADPMMGMKVREYQSERAATQAKAQREQQEAEAKVLGYAAQAAKDPASWDAVVDALGPEYAEHKGKFDPSVRTALMAQAGLADKADNPTAMQQNYEWLKEQNPALADIYLRNQAEGSPMIASNGDGTFTVIPRGMGTAPAAAAPQATSQEQYQALPPGAEYIAPDGSRRRKGGAGPQGPQTFP